MRYGKFGLVFLAVVALVSPIIEKSYAGEMEVLLKKLVEKKILTPNEAQLVLDEAKQEVAKEMAKAESPTAPSWTQKIKMKGDVRFRTQAEWGKQLSGSGKDTHGRLRERIRARIGVEGKVTDEVFGGARLVTGNDSKGNSTNQTLGDSGSFSPFEKRAVWFDQFYIRFEPNFEAIRPYQEYSKITFGKFDNPFENTELMWDSDYCPEGAALQYLSPDLGKHFGTIPFQFYTNDGILWMAEQGNFDWEQMLFVWQAGIKWDVSENSKANTAIAFYIPANTWHKTRMGASATTNTIWEPSNGGTNAMKYDFNMLDIIARWDNKNLMDYNIPNGLYADFVYNTSTVKQPFGMLLGGYLGTPKPKNKDEWKFWAEYRLLQRNCVMDWMPDSDFYGFTNTGAPKEGGTNTNGLNCGINYSLFNNVLLNLEYYMVKPLRTDGAVSTNRYEQTLQADIIVSF